MSRRERSVERALGRWTEQGLLSPDVADRLREESRAHHGRRTVQVGRALLAAAGAVALLLAAGLFAERTWPLLDEAARTLVLALVGAVVWGAGRGLAWRERWIPLSWFLVLGGLAVGALAAVYSENAWADGSAGGVAVALAALAVVAVTARPAWRGGPVTAAGHTALAFVYLASALDRSLGLGMDPTMWILDAVLLGVLVLLVLRLPRLDRDATDRALAAFVTGLYVGMVLVHFTGVGPLDLEESTAWGLDVWVVMMAALNLWLVHRGPPSLQRDLLESHMAACVVLAAGLFAFTLGEVLQLPSEAWAGVAALVGTAGLVWALRVGNLPTLVVGAAVLIFGLWAYAVDRAGAVGGVVALAVTAGLLFVGAGRIGGREGEE